MVHFLRGIGVALVLVCGVALAGCSSADSDAVPVADGDTGDTGDTGDSGQSGESASGDAVDGVEDGADDGADDGTNDDVSETSAASPADDGESASGDAVDGGDDDASAADGVPGTAEPLRPTGEPDPSAPLDSESTSAYISRLSMTSNAIEVNWSDSAGASEYHIHRVARTSEDEPGVEAMTADNRIHVADAGGRFADEQVEAGTKYWHGVREFSADGDLTAHGWHKTAAVDDEEPPSTVDGITAVAENGEVLVTWTEPDENYQLHGYRLLRGVDGEPPESIAVTWRLDQLSFIDDEPPMSAEVVYQVVASDFHWNLSSPGSVTIDLS